MRKAEELLVPVNGITLTPTAVLIEGTPPYESWSVMLTQMQHVYRCVGWWIGDMLNYGEKAYGEKYAQAIAETGLSYQTLLNYKAVAKAIPAPERVEGISWSAHRVAAFLPPGKKETVLEWAKEEADQGKPPSSRDMQRAVEALNPQGQGGTSGSAPPEGPSLVQVLLTRDECQALLDGFGVGWESARQKVEEAMLQF